MSINKESISNNKESMNINKESISDNKESISDNKESMSDEDDEWDERYLTLGCSESKKEFNLIDYSDLWTNKTLDWKMEMDVKYEIWNIGFVEISECFRVALTIDRNDILITNQDLDIISKGIKDLISDNGIILLRKVTDFTFEDRFISALTNNDFKNIGIIRLGSNPAEGGCYHY
jgi:hypothetical protein